jgi:hypothetical protein
MDYDEYTVQQRITVFWEFNAKKNNFIDKLKKLVNDVNRIDINDIDDKEKCDQCLKTIHDYELFVSKIKGLRECFNELLTQSIFYKFEKYNDDFSIKIANIFDELKKKSEINLSIDKFKKFMYENTAEGRVVMQNMNALDILKEIKITEEYIKNIRVKLIKPKITSNKNTDRQSKIEEDSEDSEDSEFTELNENNILNDSEDNKSTGSLSD